MKHFYSVKQPKPFGVIFVVQPEDEIVESHGFAYETAELKKPPDGYASYQKGSIVKIKGKTYKVIAVGWHKPSQMFCSYSYQIDIEPA